MVKKLGMFALLGVFTLTLVNVSGCSESDEDKIKDGIDGAGSKLEAVGEEAEKKIDEATH